MIGSYLMLGLALTSSNYVVNENTSNVYDITYSFTMDNLFLTHDDEFNLELYDILGLNAIEVDLGQVVYETSSFQDFEYYYNTSLQIINSDSEILYAYSNSMYCDTYSAQQWLYIDIGGVAYIDNTIIDDYLNTTFRLNFRFYCSSADTFRKTPLKQNYSAKTYHFDEKGVYQNGYRIGYDEGKEEGISIGNAQSQSLYDLLLVVPDNFVNILHNMFDFEVFGINVFNFVVSVLSIGIILWIIKKVSGN